MRKLRDLLRAERDWRGGRLIRSANTQWDQAIVEFQASGMAKDPRHTDKQTGTAPDWRGVGRTFFV